MSLTLTQVDKVLLFNYYWKQPAVPILCVIALVVDIQIIAQ